MPRAIPGAEINEACQVRYLCILLILEAVVSYRSVPRILTLFNNKTPLTLSWIPHFTSVINWTLRLGLGLLKQVKPVSYSWLAIIDHSIDIGTKKALVVLRVPVDALSKKGKALQLKDCECIGLNISETVNGESIALELSAIFNQAGSPDAIVKDCDATLQKGVRLWSETHSVSVPVIEDIGHVTATALKSQYKNSKGYKEFTELASKGASRLRQTDLSFLTAPKLRTKGRFQSISKLGAWGDKILNVLAVKGAAKKGSLLDRLRHALPGFSRLKPFISSFATTAKVTSALMELLKNKGLDQTTYPLCREIVEQLPQRSSVKKRLKQWLNKHLAIQKKMTLLPLLVSSDIIESLFGNFKYVIERSAQADMNRTALLIPALCGEVDQAAIEKAFNQARHQDLKDWEEANIPYTVRKKRQAFLNESEIQKPVNSMLA